MATLTQAVAVGDTLLHINTALADGSFPAYVKIDSEILHVGGAEHLTGTILTLSNPATAIHSSGATVTYAGRPYDADWLAAAGGLEPGAGADITGSSAEFTVDPETPEISSLVFIGDDKALVDLNADPPRVLIQAITDSVNRAELDIGADDTHLLRRNAAGNIISDIDIDEARIRLIHSGVVGASLVLQADDSIAIGFGGAQVYLDAAEADLAFGAVVISVTSAGVRMTGLPTADPVVAGALWIDTAAGRVIKVSAG